MGSIHKHKKQSYNSNMLTIKNTKMLLKCIILRKKSNWH